MVNYDLLKLVWDFYYKVVLGFILIFFGKTFITKWDFVIKTRDMFIFLLLIKIYVTVGLSFSLVSILTIKSSDTIRILRFDIWVLSINISYTSSI